MYNSPLLDIAIGLVFIFLLYSLLVASINETIATSFGLRASMLKKAIVGGMLSNTLTDNRWISLAKGIGGFFVSVLHLEKKLPKDKQKIGDKFFDHPLIKNYGSSRLFPLPSYIPTANFSTVLLDVLKQDFDSKVNEIVHFKLKTTSGTFDVVRQNLINASDTIKLKELLEYYGHHYLDNNAPPPSAIIDKDTWEILQMHLRNSFYDIKQFERKIENWFDDTMKRVTGWYKRQTQLMLFILGLLVAMIFNIDTIEITGKLSTDKNARDKLVQLAADAVDNYKDDPRVRKSIHNGVEVMATDSAYRSYNDSIFQLYQAKIDSVKVLLKGDINKTNELIAAGWGDYGKKRNAQRVLKEYNIPDCGSSVIGKSSKIDSIGCKHALDSLYNKHWIKLKVGYVLKESARGKKFLGYLVLAFAISLGAPFWFDLLNKLVKLRGSGKKEDEGRNATAAKPNPDQAPVTVIVNPQTTGEEAAG